MAKEVLKNASIFVGAADLSTYANEVTPDFDAAEVEVTNFASAGWFEGLGGIKKGSFTVHGFHDMPEPDATLWSAESNVVAAVSRTNPIAAANTAFFMRLCRSKYSPLKGRVGNAAEFDYAGYSDAPAVRGKVLDLGTATAPAGASTGQQIGSVSATQKIYAAVVVTAFDGTSLDLVIESDDNAGFTSATTRFTFTQITGTGYQWLTPVSGAIADDRWRVQRTFVGTTVTYRVFFGIL